MIKIVKGEPSVQFNELFDAVQVRLNKSLYDFSGNLQFIDYYTAWCKKKGYKGKDPAGLPLKKSKIWRAEFTKDPEGEAAMPLYQNFWHVWIEFAKFRSFGGSKKLIISEVHRKIRAATGKPSRKQVSDWKHTKDLIENSKSMNDESRASTLLSYYRSHLGSFHLEWTEEIFAVIYDLIGEYKDVPVRVYYEH